LTNNAIQKNCPSYGQQELGNQLSFEDLRSYLKSDQSPKYVDFDREILPKMKYQAYAVMHSVAMKINPFRRKNCFELFGLDFMLD
jgi:tubulin---tyrosine ligase